ncbi:hypothetical protein HJC23_008585 [Cyclotella cryptica]|uniref:Proteasome endopeptidase complex n=1 Tax=Cyclotella cryptica TaxID=29204 RepID=A0ABD3Q7E9_9STRA|eukprot:CCRYP_007936-RA/>CCRYP_007936-RA protein AED:0.03 eAED:0.03 QI:51/1/1/1/1/1/2/179/352
MPFANLATLKKWSVLLLFLRIHPTAVAQQSAAGQDTLIAVVGRDYVMMGADSSSSGGGGIALTSSDIDKLAVIHDGGCPVRDVGDDFGIGNSPEIMRGGHRRKSFEQQAIVVGVAGDAADADRLIGTLRAHAHIRELEAGIGNDAICVFDGKHRHSRKSNTLLGAISPGGLDADAIAHFARSEIASRLRSRQPLQLCLLVAGIVQSNDPGIPSRTMAESLTFSERVQKQIITGSQTYSNRDTEDQTLSSERLELEGSLVDSNPLTVPKLFWLDQYGSMQNLRYGAHGYGSNFALSILDQRYRCDLSRQEAIDLIFECFQQLRERYVINSPKKPRVKCVDAYGVREVKLSQLT